jgi:hypothetical protein
MESTSEVDSIFYLKFSKELQMKKLFLIALICIIISVSLIWAGTDIVINEIMYNSIGNDVEYVELYNASTTQYNLQNWYILDDNDSHSPCILNWTLNPGEYLIIAGDVTQFKQKYPNVVNVNPNAFDTGGTGWSLANGGDVVRLFDNNKTLYDMVAYSDGGDWPTSPDGNGPSLELLHPALDNSLPTSWDPSSVVGGTPGAKNSVYTENVQPTCKDGFRSPDLPTTSDNVVISVLAFDNEGLSRVQLYVNLGSGYVAQNMNDNGTDGDAAAGDSLFSTTIPAQASGKVVKYYAVAMDDIGQQDSWPNNAPTDYHAYTVDYQPPRLRITELLAVNNTVNKDEFGEYDDWFEIHNEDTRTVNLSGMFVSNNLNNPNAFQLPSINLAPGEYKIFWADNTPNQGNWHVDFKLSSAGEEVGIFEPVAHGNVLIDGWKYGLMSADVSMGFMPETGTAPEYLTSPTPGTSNATSQLFSPVCINEFQATSDFGGTDDWVEIYNRGTQAFDLSGCFLSDERANHTKWTFPQGKKLNPGEYLVIYEDVLGFGFSSEGSDVIMLTAADSTTGLDFYDFGAQLPDKSEGRFPDGTNTWQFFSEPTRGAANLATDVENIQTTEPQKFTLYQNYPNPFNPRTTISFSLPTKQKVTLVIYNTLGQKIITLVDDILPAGKHSVQWQADRIQSGVYFYRLTSVSHTITKKMILVR